MNSVMMGHWSAFLYLATVFMPHVLGGSGRYSKEKNQLKDDTIINKNIESKPPTQEPFRVAKLNAYWQTAQKRLNAVELRELYEELERHDKDELTIKRLRHDGGDKDGKLAVELQEKLDGIIEKYALLLLGDKEFRPKSKKKSEYKPTTLKHKRVLEFKDKKLNKLWEKAQKAGFTEEELQSLKTEFGHHQKKIDDYYTGFNEFTDESFDKENQNSDAVEGIEIDVDKLNDLEAELSKTERERQVSNVDKSKYDTFIDDKLKDLTKNFAGLKAKVQRNNHNRDSELDFKESRVEELWNQALQAGFDRAELQSLKAELAHFEKKLSKLSYLNQEIQKMAEVENDKTSDDLKNKAKQYAHKVEQSEKELEKKILSKHNEL